MGIAPAASRWYNWRYDCPLTIEYSFSLKPCCQLTSIFPLDEMGLGKTVQLAAFLGCMAASRKLKSILVIAPATMLQHWLNEVKVWAPGLRRILIHQSADDSSFTYAKRTISHGLLQNLDEWLKDCRRSRLFEAIDEADYESRDPSSFCGTGYIVVTTYENVRRFADVWTSHRWSYVVMDEAQKIRNPDADVTLVCKVRKPRSSVPRNAKAISHFLLRGYAHLIAWR